MGVNSMVPNLPFMRPTSSLTTARRFWYSSTSGEKALRLARGRHGRPLREFSEEDLESVQLLGHTLDVIETIDTDNDLDVLESLLEALDTLHNVWLLQRPGRTSQGRCRWGRHQL